MVTPERLTPGASASAWAQPTPTAVLRLNSSICRVTGVLSAYQSTPANTASRIAIWYGWPSFSSTNDSPSTPAIPAGIVATTTNQASRSSPVSMARLPMLRIQAPASAIASSRKYARTAISVPRCSDTSKVLLKSGWFSR